MELRRLRQFCEMKFHEMKELCWFLFFLPLLAIAQPGPIKDIRYNDTFSPRPSDSISPTGVHRIKYLPFGRTDSLTISIGGEVREWVEIRKNANFGDLPPDFAPNDAGNLLQRAMLHVQWNYGKKWSMFFQLNNTLEWGNPNPPVPEIAVDSFGIHQWSMAFKFVPKATRNTHYIRLGRQELSFGNELLVSSREGPNNRQSFDGLQYQIQGVKGKTTFLLATPVIIRPGVGDNIHAPEWIWGGYHSRVRKGGHGMDAYYLGMWSQRRAYQYQLSSQHRHTIGTRWFSNGPLWHYDVEGMYQTGQFDHALIHAFQFSADTRYVFKKRKWEPMIGLSAGYVSGDYHANDDQLNTFDALYPKPVYGLALPQGPSNIAHIRPTIGVTPWKNVFVNFSWYYLSRTSTQDGTYAPDMTQVRPLPGKKSAYAHVGHQFALDIFYMPSPFFSILAFNAFVKPGAYIQDTGAGKSIYYSAVSVQVKF